MFKIRLPMNWLLQRIHGAGDEAIVEIMKALIRWQRRWYSDYELVIVSLPRTGGEERIRQIDFLAHILKKHTYTELETI